MISLYLAMNALAKSVTRLRETRLLLFTAYILFTSIWTHISAGATAQGLLRGFKATPDPKVPSFQPLLNDSTGNFSLAFLRVNNTQLSLAVLHLRSSESLWLANLTKLASWSDTTQLFFNGSLVISDPHSNVFWSTGTDGDLVALLNSSNLQIHKLEDHPSVIWQSFDFPTDTLVETQNLTANTSLISSNGFYSMRLGYDFWGLYANFGSNSDQIYYKHTAMEAKAEVVEGHGPIYAQVNTDGYLGIYQNGSTPVDIQPFNSFHRPINGFLRLRLEPDGNLKGYYWDGSAWALDYQAISDPCELPSLCGSYGLCRPGYGCSCLDNRTAFHSGEECFPLETGDFCSEEVIKDNFWVLRRNGVELPYKEHMQYETTSSPGECASLCENNCSCWGAVYNNGSGFCYMVSYPIQTLVAATDESKLGYFKVREGVGKKKRNAAVRVGYVLGGLAAVVLIGTIGIWTYKMWRRKTRAEEGEVSPGPYKDLGSASFKSIEMSNR
ncbi:PAN domain-containing protein At5g03700-like [Juglans regia]|uniref:PAN domain-containing protein At5g03700-like n=2 Tax=Juglans regia TaxID=51240 RepID=A0A2I4FLN8_JUGRE|nr:PAN domain-containing protein At5g03700-like [Juglans regia]